MTMRKDQNLQVETLKNLLAEVESLRVKRQQAYANQSHPLLKRFNQQELNDMACPTYKNLLTGRSHRIPDRQMIVRIATYLECTSIEQNDLLVAAGYLPFHQRLEGEAWEQALEEARQIMSSLPLPAMIVDQALAIKGVNDSFSQLFDLPAHPAFYKDLNMADLHFNSEFPVRSRSTFDAASFELWESHAIDGIQAYKTMHIYSRHELWYKQGIRKLQKYDDFNKYWNKQPGNTRNELEQHKMILAEMGNTGKWVPIRYKQIHISTSHHMHPRIEAFLPVDDAARMVFKQLGCQA
ncbi:XRE family transcriptional regulator [Paenibacillus sp. FSL H7-0357]|nr:hypothetical protein [Paenibacillus sp. FSL H7-0357]AIQ17708.1 XRE family transcriptional regulator [Paenibacillus sp. FSL H7-0357]